MKARLSPLLFFFIACGGGEAYLGSEDDAPGADAGAGNGAECFSSNECPPGYSCTEFGVCEPPDPGVSPEPEDPPPEIEIEFDDPQSSLRYVYVAMTDLDALARIDGEDLTVRSVEVGEAPEVVATAPNSDTAVVVDAMNGALSIVRPTSDSDQRIVVPILPHLNSVAVSPDGKYAVCWFQLSASTSLVSPSQIGSFQELSVVHLENGAEDSVDLTVGFEPRDIYFDQGSNRAYVVTRDGVSIVDFAEIFESGPQVVPPIPITDFSDDVAEILITPGGQFALARVEGTTTLSLVRLLGSDAGQRYSIDLPASPSDLDIDSSGENAYAVLRETSSIAHLRIPEDFVADSATVELVVSPGLGSLTLSDDGNRGLIYTNASASELVVAVDLGAGLGAQSLITLRKSVRTAAFDPSGERALVIHAKQAGDPLSATSVDELIDLSYGYSLVNIDSNFSKLQITEADPGAFAFAPNNPRAYIILDSLNSSSTIPTVQLIELDSGVVRDIELSSPPVAIGILPETNTAFVSQDHPLGRISFIDIDEDSYQTLTGFDLNSRIID